MATVVSPPIASGGSSVTESFQASASTRNVAALPSRSTFETARSAASSESSESG